MRRLGFGSLIAVLALAVSAGGSMEAGSGQRELTIVSAYFHGGRDQEHTLATTRAIRAVLAGRRERAGPYEVRYLDSEAGPSQDQQSACEAAGRRYAANPRIVAVIGPRSTVCARLLVPALNRAGMLVVSPTVDLPGLTHAVPGEYTPDTCFECSPAQFYPTGVRHFARVVAAIDSEGLAALRFLRERKARRVFIVRERGDTFHGAYISLAFAAEARRVGVRVVGTGFYTVDVPSSRRAVARRAARSRASAILFLAPSHTNGASVLKEIRRAGYRGTILGSLSMTADSILKDARSAIENVYFTFTRLPIGALPPAAARFTAATGTQAFGSDAAYTAEATHAVLDAISASDGSRAGVREAFFKVNRNGLLGSLRFDANGDVRPQRIAVFQVQRGRFVYRRTITLDGE